MINLKYRRESNMNLCRQYTKIEFIVYFQHQAINRKKFIHELKIFFFTKLSNRDHGFLTSTKSVTSF